MWPPALPGADAKELHGHRYARFRGLGKVREQSLLSAACQNMKKIAQAVFLRLRGPNTEPKPGFTAPGIESGLFFLPMRPKPLAA